MRLLIVMALVLSSTVFAQRVRENVKQQTVLGGSRAVQHDFEVTPAPVASSKSKIGKKKK